MRTQHPDSLETWASLADIEWACQHLPNLVGIQGGEPLGAFYQGGEREEFIKRLLPLCAECGLFRHEADGTYEHNKWEALLAKHGKLIADYHDYLALTQNNNILRRQFVSPGSTLGLWLSGFTAQHGAREDGGFYWQNAGFAELGERSGRIRLLPRIFCDLVFVMGLARGRALFNVDGQMPTFTGDAANVPPDRRRATIWNRRGETTAVYQRWFEPRSRAIVQHQLVLSRADVLKNVRIAVFNDGVKTDAEADPY